MKRFLSILALLMTLTLLLTGCELPIPDIDIPFITSDPIVCLVTAKEERTLTVEVQCEDRHYDEGDTLIINYLTIQNGSAVNPGDQITFDYDYMNKVSVRGDYPYIQVESVTITHWDPPETTEESPE